MNALFDNFRVKGPVTPTRVSTATWKVWKREETRSDVISQNDLVTSERRHMS